MLLSLDRDGQLIPAHPRSALQLPGTRWALSPGVSLAQAIHWRHLCLEEVAALEGEGWKRQGCVAGTGWAARGCVYFQLLCKAWSELWRDQKLPSQFGTLLISLVTSLWPFTSHSKFMN